MNAKQIRLAGAALALAVAATSSPAGAFASTRTVWVAGDQHSCRDTGDAETAALVGPGTVVADGDLSDETGTAGSYDACYTPKWGRFLDRTFPVAGNHDFYDGGAAFLDYFRDRLGHSSHPTYYRRGRGAWDLYFLDSNCEWVTDAPCDAQAAWLRRQMNRHPSECTAAFFHRAAHSSHYTSGERRPTRGSRLLFKVLANHGADLLVTAHWHGYERFGRFGGLREIVASTGGATNWGLRPTDEPAPKSQVRLPETHGVLRLTLRDHDYLWDLIGTDSLVLDHGASRCR